MTIFAPVPADKKCLEQGSVFAPRFNIDGLIPAVVSDVGDGSLLMVAYMNEQALGLTLETGIAHFWSRSRNSLWKKGESSGNQLQVEEIRTDCDQDVLWLKVRIDGQGVACHTGARSCFYRKLDRENDKVVLVNVPLSS